MPVKYVAGDLLADEGITAIAHGCNTKGAMGAGIAKDIKKLFPKNYDSYKEWCDSGSFSPGLCLTAHEEKLGNHRIKFVHNLATQEGFGDAKLEHIEKSLTNMIVHAKTNKETKIGIPRIGAGLGGLEWDDVKKVIQKVGDSPECAGIELIVFEDFIKGQKNYTKKTEKKETKYAKFDQDLIKAEKTNLIKLGFDNQKFYAKTNSYSETLIALTDIAADLDFNDGGAKLIQELVENKALPKECFEDLLGFMHDIVISKDCDDITKDVVADIIEIMKDHPNLKKGLVEEFFGETLSDSEEFIKSLTETDILKSDDSVLLFKLASSISGVYEKLPVSIRISGIKRFCKLHNSNDSFEDIAKLFKKLGENKLRYKTVGIENISNVRVLEKLYSLVHTDLNFNFTNILKEELKERIDYLKEQEKNENTIQYDGDGNVNIDAQSLKDALLKIVKYASVLDNLDWKHPGAPLENVSGATGSTGSTNISGATGYVGPDGAIGIHQETKDPEAKETFAPVSRVFTDFADMILQVKNKSYEVKGKVYPADEGTNIGYFVCCEEDESKNFSFTISVVDTIKSLKDLENKDPATFIILEEMGLEWIVNGYFIRNASSKEAICYNLSYDNEENAKRIKEEHKTKKEALIEEITKLDCPIARQELEKLSNKKLSELKEKYAEALKSKQDLEKEINKKSEKEKKIERFSKIVDKMIQLGSIQESQRQEKIKYLHGWMQGSLKCIEVFLGLSEKTIDTSVYGHLFQMPSFEPMQKRMQRAVKELKYKFVPLDDVFEDSFGFLGISKSWGDLEYYVIKKKDFYESIKNSKIQSQISNTFDTSEGRKAFCALIESGKSLEDIFAVKPDEKESAPSLPVDKEAPPTHIEFTQWTYMFQEIRRYAKEISGDVCGVGGIEDPEICFMVYPKNADLAKTNEKAKCFKISRENFEKTYTTGFTSDYADFYKRQMSSLEGQLFMCALFAGKFTNEYLQKEVGKYTQSLKETEEPNESDESNESVNPAENNLTQPKESESKPMSNSMSSLIAPDLLKQAGIRVVCETTAAATKDMIVKLLKDRGADDFIVTAVADYIDTPIGQSVISLLYAFGLPQAKRIEFFNKNASLIDDISKEFQIQAATKSGKVVLETLKDLFLPVIQQALEMMTDTEESVSSQNQQSAQVA